MPQEYLPTIPHPFLKRPFFAKRDSFRAISENGNISVIRKYGEFRENGTIRRFYRQGWARIGFSPSLKKIRANIRYWEAKVLLSRPGARILKGRAGLRSGVTCRGITCREISFWRTFSRELPGNGYFSQNFSMSERKIRESIIGKVEPSYSRFAMNARRPEGRPAAGSIRWNDRMSLFVFGLNFIDRPEHDQSGPGFQSRL